MDLQRGIVCIRCVYVENVAVCIYSYLLDYVEQNPIQLYVGKKWNILQEGSRDNIFEQDELTTFYTSSV